MNVIEKVSSSKIDDYALRNNGIEITHTLTVSKSVQIGKYKYCNCYDITKIKDFPIDRFKDKISFNIISTTNYCSDEESVKSKKLVTYNNTTEQRINVHLLNHYDYGMAHIKYGGFTDPTIVAEISFGITHNKIYTLYKIDENVFHIKAEFSDDTCGNIKLLYVLKGDTLTILE